MLRTKANSPLRQVFEGFRQGQDKSIAEAQALTFEKISDLIEAEKVSVDNLSIGEAFDVFALAGKDVNLNSAHAISEAVASSYFPKYLGRMATPKILGQYNHWVAPVERFVTEYTDPVRANYGYYQRLLGAEGPELVKESQAYETTGMSEYEVAIENFKFGRIIEITKEMLLFDKTGEVLRKLNNFGSLMGRHRMNMILEAATGMPSTATGKSANDWFRVNGTSYGIYATTHATVPGNAGYANQNWITGVALTVDGLGTVTEYFGKMVDYNGEYLDIMPTDMIVSPGNRVAAMRLNQQTQDPNAAIAGNMNPWTGAFTPLVWPRLTNNNRFWVGEWPRQLIWQWNWMPMVETLTTMDAAATNDIVMMIKGSYNGGVGNVDNRYSMMVDN
jgi:hypothetical protein